MGYRICANRYHVDSTSDFYEQLMDFVKDKNNIEARLTASPTHYPCEVYFVETPDIVEAICNYDKQTWASPNILNNLFGFILGYPNFDIQFITTSGIVRHGHLIAKSSNYWTILKFKLRNMFRTQYVNEHTLTQLAPCFEDINKNILKEYQGAEILITQELVIGGK